MRRSNTLAGLLFWTAAWSTNAAAHPGHADLSHGLSHALHNAGHWPYLVALLIAAVSVGIGCAIGLKRCARTKR